MEGLGVWTTSVAAAAIISSVIQMLLPDGKAAKYVRFVCAVVLVICIISPVKSIDTDKIKLEVSALFSDENAVSYVSVLDEQTERLYRKRIEEIVTCGLRENCKTEAVCVDMKLSVKNGETTLSEMTVYIAKSDSTKSAACEYYLKKTLGFDAEIKISE